MLEWIKKQMASEDEEDGDEETASENGTQPDRPVIIRAHLSCYEDAVKVADHLAKERIVIMDLCDLEEATAQRVIDFMCGAAYMAAASIARLASGVYLLVPLEADYIDDLVPDLPEEPEEPEETPGETEPLEERPEGPDTGEASCGNTEAGAADAPEGPEEKADRQETAAAEPVPHDEDENDRP